MLQLTKSDPAGAWTHIHIHRTRDTGAKHTRKRDQHHHNDSTTQHRLTSPQTRRAPPARSATEHRPSRLVGVESARVVELVAATRTRDTRWASDDQRTRYADVRHACQPVARSGLSRRHAEAATHASDDKGSVLGRRPRAGEAPLPLGDAAGREGDEVVHVGSGGPSYS